MSDDPWQEARRILDRNWNEEGGYTAPNHTTYPWRWLWDSCFHAVLWARLDPERARRELEAVFGPQDQVTGFVPHVDYRADPDFDLTLWGRPAVSTITQPPMFGHAIRVMVERGVEIPDRLLTAARRGLGFFFDWRLEDGMVVALHPWEVGCDDSPRWDSWVHHPFTRSGFLLVKGRLVAALELDENGVAVGSREFRVGSVALTALVAFNARELAAVTGDESLRSAAAELVDGLEERWDEEPGIWVDTARPVRSSAGAPTLEAYLPLLVDDRHWERARSVIGDPAGFDAPYGPRQVDRRYPGYRGDGYWRGATWPQLNYLLWVAARRWGDDEWADRLARSTLAGALASGWSEYWDPDTGHGAGATPQSWTALAAEMADPTGP